MTKSELEKEEKSDNKIIKIGVGILIVILFAACYILKNNLFAPEMKECGVVTTGNTISAQYQGDKTFGYARMASGVKTFVVTTFVGIGDHVCQDSKGDRDKKNDFISEPLLTGKVL